MIRQYLVRQMTEHKCAPRIYLDIRVLKDAGFEAGTTYSRHPDLQNRRVLLKVDPAGKYTVSGKEVRGETIPVIDINSKQGLEPLAGLKAVRLVIQDNMICAMPLASEVSAKKRLQRLKESLSTGSLVVGSLSHGGGLLDHAAHEGLHEAGLNAVLAIANEIDGTLLEHAIGHNEIWTGETIGLAAPMQEVVQDEWLMSRLPKLDVLSVGIPCSGASRAGVSKRGLGMMEEHPEVGHLVASFLMVVQQTQPAIVTVECVKEYQQSASAQIMRQHLRDSGYSVQEAMLDGKSFGVLENRHRWVLVAATQGIEIDLLDLAPPCVPVKLVKDILDDVPLDDPAWKDFQYLRVKEQRDKEKGNGFAMQIVSPSDSQVPVLRKGYFKGGSTDPLLKHPSIDGLYRKFTQHEHARIKEHPVHLVADMSQGKAHEMLGQSILRRPFVALYRRIGENVLKWAQALVAEPCQDTQPQYRLALATG